MDITESSKQAATTLGENLVPNRVISTTREQASSSTSVNDAINTHERQQRTEPLRNSPSNNKKNIVHPCDIHDPSRYEEASNPIRKFF